MTDDVSDDLQKQFSDAWREVEEAVDRFSVVLEQSPLAVSPLHMEWEGRADYTLVNRGYFELLQGKADEFDEMFRDPEREEREQQELLAMLYPTKH